MVNLLKRPQDYTGLRRQKSLFLLFLLFLLILAAFCAINAGSLHYSLGEVCRALFHPDDSQASTVIWQMRLPRVAAGIFAGAGLALAGCILQNNLQPKDMSLVLSLMQAFQLYHIFVCRIILTNSALSFV